VSKPVNLEDVMTELAIYYVYLAVGTMIVAYLQTGLFSLTAVRQTKKMRAAFFNSVMRQNIGWFDTYDAGELNSRLTE
jgi:ABC-type multidrug transport system fused ATPase/permease subunit